MRTSIIMVKWEVDFKNLKLSPKIDFKIKNLHMNACLLKDKVPLGEDPKFLDNLFKAISQWSLKTSIKWLGFILNGFSRENFKKSMKKYEINVENFKV